MSSWFFCGEGKSYESIEKQRQLKVKFEPAQRFLVLGLKWELTLTTVLPEKAGGAIQSQHTGCTMLADNTSD